MPGGRAQLCWYIQITSCACLMCVATTAHAQRLDSLSVGATVRQQTGPVSNKASLQKLAERQSLGQAWKRGSVIGGVVGVTIGGAAIAIGAYKDNHDTCTCVRKRAAIAYVLSPAFAAGTAALGGWISARTRNARDTMNSPDR